jgi:hypothetical protein
MEVILNQRKRTRPQLIKTFRPPHPKQQVCCRAVPHCDSLYSSLTLFPSDPMRPTSPQPAFPHRHLALLCLYLAGSLSAEGAAPGAPADFAHQVAPTLKELCGNCHLGDKKKGGFSMNNQTLFLAGSENGAVFDKKSPSASTLLKVLLSTDPDTVMPPPAKDRKRPTPQQLQLLQSWLESGAAWEEGFSFVKPAYNAPVKPRLPTLPSPADSTENPLDRLLRNYYSKNSLQPPPSADDAQFARRVSLDLIGLLPEPDSLRAFVADTSPDKRSRLVDTLLARNTEYTEHWLTFWNDLLRNDYGGTGFITGGRKQVSSWLYEALYSNRPYDAMVRELVNPSAATDGFASGITWRGSVSASQTREVQYAQSISQSFLGLNLKCASCHDSFIDHWKLTDAYGLAAIYSDKPIEIARCEKLTGKIAQPAWPFPEIGQVDRAAPREARLQKLAELMTHRENGWFARTMVNRLWAQLMGRGLVHPVDAMGSEPWSEELLDYQGWAFADGGFNLKAALRLIATSKAYQAEVAQRNKDDATTPFVFKGPRAKRMTAEQYVDAVWQITRTAPKKWDAPVRRGEPRADLLEAKPMQAVWISPVPRQADTAPAPAGTPTPGPISILQKTFTLKSKPGAAAGVLAASGDARLYINGAEVKAPHLQKHSKVSELHIENLLKAGENTFVLAGRDPKALFAVELSYGDGSLESIVSDPTWMTAAGFQEESLKKGTFPAESKALPGESRTSALPAPPPKDAELQIERLRGDYVWAVQPQPPARASLLKSDLLMRTLGRPNRDQIVTNRPQDLSTLEALDLSAGARLSELLAGAAARIAKEAAFRSPNELVDWLYTAALGRQPSNGERAASVEALGQKPAAPLIEDLLWSVFVLPEFQLVR